MGYSLFLAFLFLLSFQQWGEITGTLSRFRGSYDVSSVMTIPLLFEVLLPRFPWEHLDIFPISKF